MTPPSLRCDACGETLRDDGPFCPRCGAFAGGAGPSTPTPAAPSARTRSGEWSTDPTQVGPWERLLPRLREAVAPRYRILRLLGWGGMAGVYLAEEPRLGRRVAVKVISPGLMIDPSQVERFVQEARTTAQLTHPHIVTIYDVGEREELHYFTMRYVPGRSLGHVMKSSTEPLPVPVVQAWLAQVAGALGHAHRQGVVHRDIKPGNILLDDTGNALVTDFGIAKVADEPGLTRTGILVGTPAYMSPEQCSGSQVTGASDQYALGAVAYQMLTGEPPFTGPTMAVIQAHLTARPKPIQEKRPDVPAHMAAMVDRMLEKAVDDRWPDLEHAVDALGAPALRHGDPLRLQLQDLAAWAHSITLSADRFLHRRPTPSEPVPVGEVLRTTAVVRSAADRVLTGRRVELEAEPEGVLGTGDDGAVEALRPGQARLIARCEGARDELVVHVVPVQAELDPRAEAPEPGAPAREEREEEGVEPAPPVAAAPGVGAEAPAATVSPKGPPEAEGEPPLPPTEEPDEQPDEEPDEAGADAPDTAAAEPRGGSSAEPGAVPPTEVTEATEAAATTPDDGPPPGPVEHGTDPQAPETPEPVTAPEPRGEPTSEPTPTEPTHDPSPEPTSPSTPERTWVRRLADEGSAEPAATASPPTSVPERDVDSPVSSIAAAPTDSTDSGGATSRGTRRSRPGEGGSPRAETSSRRPPTWLLAGGGTLLAAVLAVLLLLPGGGPADPAGAPPGDGPTPPAAGGAASPRADAGEGRGAEGAEGPGPAAARDPADEASVGGVTADPPDPGADAGAEADPPPAGEEAGAQVAGEGGAAGGQTGEAEAVAGGGQERAAGEEAAPEEPAPPRDGMLQLTGDLPAGAEIRITGNGVDRRTRDRTVALPPGSYAVEVTAEGYETARTRVNVDPGARVAWTPVLPAVQAAEPDPMPTEPPEEEAGEDEPATPDPAAARAGVVAALEAFAAALQARDMNALREAWPTMPDAQARGWEQFVGSREIRNLQTSVSTDGDPTIQGDRADVVMLLRLRYTNPSQPPPEGPLRYRAVVERTGEGRWVIRDLEAGG